ncbi:hypothetical protein Ccrd_026583, partial [Cynara cardunculus var. scolymus]
MSGSLLQGFQPFKKQPTSCLLSNKSSPSPEQEPLRAFHHSITGFEMVADKGKKPEIGEKIVEDNTEQIMSLFYPLQSCRRSKMNLKRYKWVILLHISQRNSKLFVCVIHHQVEGIEEILKPSRSESDGSSIELPAKGEENKSRNCASNNKQDDWSWSKEAIGEVNELKTLIVSSTRKKASTTSCCNVGSQLNECEEIAKNDCLVEHKTKCIPNIL